MANHYTFGIGQPHTQVDDDLPPVLYDEATQSLITGDGTVISGVGSYTFATLPSAAANPGILAFVSDVGGGTYWRSNGTRWKPQNNNIVLDSLGADVTTTGTTEVILKQITFPAGMLKDYDRFFQWISLSKSSTSETATFRWRFGPLGTIADPVLAPSAGATSNNTAIATTNDTCGLLIEWKRKSATTLKLTGSGASNTKFGGPSTGDTTPATTVADMDSNTNYLSFTCAMSAAVEVLTLEDMVTELRGHTA